MPNTVRSMTAYTLNGVGVLYFAGWKSHSSLYPASDALVEAVADGVQPLMIEESPDMYFHPPSVGAEGWVGVLLDQIADDTLESHLREARRIIAPRRKPARKRRGI